MSQDYSLNEYAKVTRSSSLLINKSLLLESLLT